MIGGPVLCLINWRSRKNIECNCYILEKIEGEAEYARCTDCHNLWHLENGKWVLVTFDLDEEDQEIIGGEGK